jgi:hypothetical protein
MKKSWLSFALFGSVLFLAGCGGGSDVKVSKKACDMIVPEWTKQTMSIETLDDAKKALTPVMMVINAQLDVPQQEKPFHVRKVENVEQSGFLSPEMSRMYHQFRTGEWLVESLKNGGELVPARRTATLETSEYNCTYGGKADISRDGRETENWKWSYIRFSFHQCKDTPEILEEILALLGENLPDLPSPKTSLDVQPEESNATVTLNGILELNVTSPVEDEPLAYAPASEVTPTSARFVADDFTVRYDNPDENRDGYLGADLTLEVTVSEPVDGIYGVNLYAHGCAALRGSENDQEVINANFTADRTSLEYNETEIDENTTDYRFVFDGYAGLSGVVDADDEESDESLNLGLFQFYGEAFTLEIRDFKDRSESNITLTGKYGTSCMGGVASYDGRFTEEYDNNGSLVGGEGNLTLNDGEARMEINESGITVTVGADEYTGEPDTFIDANCSFTYPFLSGGLPVLFD